MNSTQTQTSVATLVSFLAGLLAGKGVFGLDTATWATVLGAVVTLGTIAWSAIITRKTAIVTQVANLPEVKNVTVESSKEGTALAQATPNNVTVG